MNYFDLKQKAIKLVQDYTGVPVDDLDIVVDGFVQNTYAIRADLKNQGRVEFLISRVPMGVATEDDLEEVSFREWPPQSRTED